jgi:hypothetical protein
MKLFARLVEQRLRTREFNCDRYAVGAHKLDVFAHVCIGDDQRVLDERASLLRKQPVEAAVERHTRHHGDRNRRNRGDDRKQGDDAHVQPCRGAPAAPRLHDAPYLASYHEDQKKDRDRVCEQEGNDDLVRRCNGREAGKHDEGHQRREQRKGDGGNAKRPPDRSRRWRSGGAHQFGSGGLANAGHRLISSQTGTRNSA